MNSAPAVPLTRPMPLVEWLASAAPVPYRGRARHHGGPCRRDRHGAAPECVWLLEHPPVYTAGTSADPSELLSPQRFPVYRTGRGGRFTYHGPGQRVAYVMLDLSARGRDVKAFVASLEDWLIATLARLGVEGERHPGPDRHLRAGRQDRLDRRARAALGEPAWRKPERRSGA